MAENCDFVQQDWNFIGARPALRDWLVSLGATKEAIVPGRVLHIPASLRVNPLAGRK